jgi:hypothetical protein
MTKREEITRLSNELLEAKYTLKDLKGITYRTINYWDDAGFLLRKRRKTERGWRRFSVIEFLWVKLLDELRTLNITIEPFIPVLFRAFGYTKEANKELETAQFNFLNSLIPIIVERKSVDLKLYTDKALIEIQKDDSNEILHENFISISLNRLLIDFVLSHGTNKLSKIPFLNEHESELISLINSNSLEEVIINVGEALNSYKFKERTKIMDTIGVTESIFKPYSKITYKLKGGKTVTLERDK